MAIIPGAVRDAVVNYLTLFGGEASLAEIHAAVEARIGSVPASSVRSYLNLNVPDLFTRTGRGCYRANHTPPDPPKPLEREPAVRSGLAELFHADCFEWLAARAPSSVHAVVTDPPYGLIEYSAMEQAKLRTGKGGVWQIPPSFDGHKRSPLPRFTVLDAADKRRMYQFFHRFAVLVGRVLVPGGNVLVASNPLLAHIVAGAMSDGGLEMRGMIVRLTMTMRGGDRPKNAHEEFDDVSVMPRSMWEPWVMMRRPMEGRVQDNLRKWKTGGFRRPGPERPFGDVIRSRPTPRAEKSIAQHPSLKPQEFLREIVRGALPLREGIVLDPFAGSGSTLAAANHVGYRSIGIESDARFVTMAREAIPALSSIELVDPAQARPSNARPVRRGRSRARLAPRD